MNRRDLALMLIGFMAGIAAAQSYPMTTMTVDRTGESAVLSLQPEHSSVRTQDAAESGE